jgi:hypothetical protein
MLSAFPNPIATGGSCVRVEMAAPGPATVAIWDVGGRLVRKLYDGALEPGAHDFAWDRRDARGRTVPAGIYWIRARAAGHDAHQRLVVLQ